MPSHTQTMVEAVASTKGMGASDTATVQASFPASPIYKGDLTDQSIKDEFQTLVLDGEVNDGGHTFGTYSRDYPNAPDISEVEWGGGGLPGSPWTPNPVSPGPGSINASDQADPPDGWGQTPPEQWGTGVGSQLQPSESSTQQSGGVLGDYVMGKAWGASS